MIVCFGTCDILSLSPVDDALVAQVVESQGNLTDVQLDSGLREVNILLQVVAQVTSKQQVHHHEHVFLILK